MQYLEDVHVVHADEHRFARKLRRQLTAPPLELGPREAGQQARRVDACTFNRSNIGR